MLTYVLIAAALQGLILAAFLAGSQENRLANRFLALLLVVFSAQMVLVANDRPAFFMKYPHLLHIGWVLPTLYGPLIYLFVRKLISKHPRLQWKDLLHLLPFLFCLLILLPFFGLSAAEKRAFLSDTERYAQADFGWLNQLVNILHVFYFGLTYHLLKRHEERIKQTYSAIEKIRLKWLRDFLFFILLTLCIGIPVFYARKWNIPILSDVYPWHYLLVAAMVYWIGYRELRQKAIFTPGSRPPEIETAKLEESSVKYQKNALPEDKAAEYLTILLDFMKTEKPYLQNELTIQRLAEMIDIPRHHLSQIINEKLNKNFYDFINGYRVKAAMRMLTEQRYDHLTTLAIAEEAGFNSKATFNAVFKKMTGLTPSEFSKKQKIEV